MTFSIRRADPQEQEAAPILARHLTAMHGHTPLEHAHALDASGLARDDIRFYLIARAGAPIGMGALRIWPDHTGELKSMHILSEARGAGAGRALLGHLLAEARALGLSRVNLETGTGPVFAAAQRMYAAAGFTPCGAFGGYRPSPHNMFMTRPL